MKDEIRRNVMRRLDLSCRKNINRLLYGSEGINHFLAKSICFVLLRNGVPAELAKKCVEDCFTSWKMAQEAIELTIKNWKSDRTDVISEAKIKNEGQWDLLIPDTGERIEIVDSNDKAVKPYDDKTIVVRI